MKFERYPPRRPCTAWERRRFSIRGASYGPLMVMGGFALVSVVLVFLYLLSQLESLSDQLGGGGALRARQARTVEGPNVILISVDGLRPDHLKSYGYARDTSPALDRLAREGVLFENVYSTTSWALPAHMALMTGLPDQVHRVTTPGRTLSKEWPCLAERFKMRGYATAGFFASPFLDPLFGFQRGFDRYESCMQGGSLFGALSPEAFDARKGEILSDRSAPRVLSAALRWLEDRRMRVEQGGTEAPFFLFLHFFDLHHDYLPPKECDLFYPDYKGAITGADYENNGIYHPAMAEDDLKRVVSLYDGEIRCVDRQIQQLLDWMTAKGILDSTVIAVTAAHGEEFFEHGARGHWNRNGLHREVVEIPLILRSPGLLPQGKRISGQFRIIDVMPTLLDLAGVAVPGTVIGNSLKPFAKKEQASGSPRLSTGMAVSELTYPAPSNPASGGGAQGEHRILSIRTDGFHLTWFTETGKVTLFHMGEDPGEHRDLAGEKPDLAGRLKSALERQDKALLRIGESKGQPMRAGLDSNLFQQWMSLEKAK